MKKLTALGIFVVLLVTGLQMMLMPTVAAQTDERILTIAMGEPIDSPNPFVGITDNAYIFFGLVYDYLMTPNGTLVNKPNLATSWWHMSGATAAASGTDFALFPQNKNTSDWPFGSIWEYNLTDKAYWNDGVQFTAEDVKWTIDIQIGPNFMTYWAYQPYTRWIYHVEKIGDFKVRIFFADLDSKKPTAVAFGGNIYMPMMPKHAFLGQSTQYLSNEWDGLPAIGTGYFKGTANLEQELIAKESVSMIANSFYNYTENGEKLGLGTVYNRDIQIDRLVMKFFSEETTLALAIKTGDADVGEILPQTYLTWLDDTTLPSTISLQSILSPTAYSKQVVINDYAASAAGDLNAIRLDPAVQRAFALSIDKNYIKDTVYKGLADIGYGLISKVWPDWYWEPDDTPSTFEVKDENDTVIYTYTLPMDQVMNYDTDRANEILDAAGYVWTGAEGASPRKAGPLAARRLVAMDFANDINSVLDKEMKFEMVVESEVFEDKEVGIFLVEEFEKVGIWIDADGVHAISLVNTATWNQLIYGYLYNTMQTYWSGDIDPNYLCYVPTSFSLFGWNEFGTNETEYDNLYLKTVTSFNYTERKYWVDECSKWMYLSGSVVTTVYPKVCFAINDESWEGWGNWTVNPGMTEDAFWTENPLWWHLKYKESAGIPIDSMIFIIAGIGVLAIIAAVVTVIILGKKKKIKMLEEEEEEEHEES